MFDCPIGRLPSPSAPELRRTHRRRARESGRGGIAREPQDDRGRFAPARSLPVLIPAALLPISLLISPGFLLPLRIEMLIDTLDIEDIALI